MKEPYFLVSALLGGVYLLVWLLRIGRRPANYPPGPPTLPILGNIHQMPTRDTHKQLQEWAQEYGPVYSLMLGTKIMIVLSSDTAIKDLLDKRGAIYSGRPSSYVGQELCSGGLRFLLIPYGETWRMMRTMAHGLLNIVVAKSYVTYQMLENKQMLYDILHRPDDFLYHIRRYSNSLTTSMTYGWRSPTYDDPKVKQLFDGFEQFCQLALSPAASLIDFYPVLRYLPLPMFSTARSMHKKEKELYVGHWNTVKKQLRDGTARPCFCTDMAEMQKQDGFSDDLAAYISGSFLEAGSDTTSSTLYGFVQAMLLFQSAQKKAHDELDRVVGGERLPTMDDEPSLQYIRGCVKESLRWMPTTITGAAPHACTSDDEYMGFHIPNGAIVLDNVYTINMDPQRFPNPREFNPDRYKNDLLSAFESATTKDVSQRDHFTFGAGRHLCQGMHLAERSLFLGISRILWAFEILPALDESRKEIIPDPERLTQGLVCMPEIFPARFVPRSKERVDLIEREWAEAKELLDPATMQWLDVPKGLKFKYV